MNKFTIDLKKGISYSKPYISKFSSNFDCVEFVLDVEDGLSDCAFAVVYSIEGNTGMSVDGGGNITTEYDSDNNIIKLTWILGRDVSCNDGVVLYQVVAYKTEDDKISAVWYSPQGRIVVGDSIDTTEYETLKIGSEPSLVSQFITLANNNKSDIAVLKNDVASVVENNVIIEQKADTNTQSIMLNSQNISQINNKLDITNNDLANVKQTAYNNNDEIIRHDHRLGNVEGNIHSINSNISDIINDVQTSKTNINQNLDKINNITSVVNINKDNIASNSESINSIEKAVEGLVSDMDKKIEKVEGMGLSEISFTNEDKLLLQSVNTKPGAITDEGGEIFNDYTQNKAKGKYTSAKGRGTVAGGDITYEVENIAFNGYDANRIIVNDADSLSKIKIGDILSGKFDYDIDIGGYIETGGTKTFSAKVVGIEHEEVIVHKAIASDNLNSWIVKNSSITGIRYNIQNVDGLYNIEDSDTRYLHITGNGESDSQRSNAYTLDKNGVAWFKGGVKVGGSDMHSGETLITNEKWELVQSYTITEDDGELSELLITFPEGYKEFVVTLERTAPTATSNTIIYPRVININNGMYNFEGSFWDNYDGTNSSRYELKFSTMKTTEKTLVKLEGYKYVANQSSTKGKPQTVVTSGWCEKDAFGGTVKKWQGVKIVAKLNVGSKYSVWGCK